MEARLRYGRISPRKLRLVADLIRGKKVEAARSILKYCPRRGAYFLIKLLNSAVANALHSAPELDEERLYIKTIAVNPGSIVKRWGTAPRGRGVPIKKRTSHATIILNQKAEKIKPLKAAKEKPKTTIPPHGAAKEKEEVKS